MLDRWKRREREEDRRRENKRTVNPFLSPRNEASKESRLFCETHLTFHPQADTSRTYRRPLFHPRSHTLGQRIRLRFVSPWSLIFSRPGVRFFVCRLCDDAYQSERSLRFLLHRRISRGFWGSGESFLAELTDKKSTHLEQKERVRISVCPWRARGRVSGIRGKRCVWGSEGV